MAWPTVALILVCGYARLAGGTTAAFTVICTVAVVVPEEFDAVMT
jgi:hypothetical protein